MDDADIRQLLEDAIARPDLTIRVEALGRHLHILLISESNTIADLAALGELIAEEVGTFVSEIDVLILWTRCGGGDEAARRYATIALQEAPAPVLPSTPESEARLEPEPLNLELHPRALADFCFVNNTMLLAAPLPAPHPEVTEAVLTFHGWERDTQLQVAPILKSFFRTPDEKWVDRVPFAQQQWMRDLAEMRRDRLTSVATWLSRYCSHPEEVMRELDRKLNRRPARVPEQQSTPESSATLANDSVSNTSTHPQAIAKALNATLARHGFTV
ncbi:MAG: hypothetical protein AAFY15_03580, partial [Cyanobacteria bacterium J06648_11]